ncbi:MAG: 4Fe-4S binding protein, partial [Gammaproteobacteria bacterium]|nr:4Fe-4S binding protein [Gammaproteobacteria bacterium]
MPGRFRRLKNMTSLVWLIYFFGPYLRFGDRQAILLDIPNRQFHFYGVTILPQDVWILSLVLLFFAILLAAVTSTIGRAFCGYFCFQTIWTDAFTWIEEKLEGKPAARYKLEQSPWTPHKFRLRVMKYFLWLLISVFTGISFVAWFTDAHQLWLDLFTLQVGSTALIVIALFTGGTFLLAGFMREQVCFWLCPYARIQGVMYDSETILPTYD